MIKPNFNRNSNVCGAIELLKIKMIFVLLFEAMYWGCGSKAKIHSSILTDTNSHSHYRTIRYGLGYGYSLKLRIHTHSVCVRVLFCRHSIICNSKYFLFHRGMGKHWALNNYTNMSIDIRNCPQIMCGVGVVVVFPSCCGRSLHFSRSFLFFVFFEMLVWRLNVIRIARQKWLSVMEWMKQRELQTKLRIRCDEREWKEPNVRGRESMSI